MTLWKSVHLGSNSVRELLTRMHTYTPICEWRFQLLLTSCWSLTYFWYSCEG